MVRWITNFLSAPIPRWHFILALLFFTYIPGSSAFTKQGIDLAIQAGSQLVQGTTQIVGSAIR